VAKDKNVTIAAQLEWKQQNKKFCNQAIRPKNKRMFHTPSSCLFLTCRGEKYE
jgi:hypothetical protein